MKRSRVSLNTVLNILIVVAFIGFCSMCLVAAAINVSGGNTTISFVMPNADALRLRDALCAKSPLESCTLSVANAQLKKLLIETAQSYERKVAEDALEASQSGATPINPGN